jgi:hypothetical protein
MIPSPITLKLTSPADATAVPNEMPSTEATTCGHDAAAEGVAV